MNRFFRPLRGPSAVQQRARAWVIFGSLVLFAVSALQAQDAAAIVTRATIFGHPASARLSATLYIHAQGSVKERSLEIAMQYNGTESRVRAAVLEPAFLRNLKALQLIAEAKAETWLATSQGVRRLGSGSGDEGLFGSDFTLEDLTGLGEGKYRSVLLASTDSTSYHVQAVPTGQSSYGSIEIQLDRKDGLILQSIFLDKRGREVKRFLAKDIAQLPDGGRYVATAEIVRPDGRRSVLSVDSFETAVQFNAGYFTRGGL